LNTKLAGLIFREVSGDSETSCHGVANVPLILVSIEVEWMRSVVGENELARLVGHLSQWDLHRRGSNRGFKASSSYRNGGNEMGKETHLVEVENLRLVAELRWSPIFRRELLQAFSSYLGLLRLF